MTRELLLTGLFVVLLPTWAKAQNAKTIAARYANEPDYRAKLRQAIVDVMTHDRDAEDPARIVVALCSFDPSLNGKNARQILEERGTLTKERPGRALRGPGVR